MGDIHEFSGFRVDGGRRRLTDASGKPISLTSRAFDLLIYFVDRPGELLDKATLMREIWPDTVVEENNLNQVIASLRKALGDSPRQPRFVATEAGRGYRFIAAVETTTDARHPVRAHVNDGPSVAVLPFVNMSPERDQEYFSDGITEELISHLSKLGGLHVAGRTSSFAFKNRPEDVRVIAEKLSVAHILEGSVRKAGDRVRIAVQLVKASDGYRLWSESFDRVLDDIFAIQDEIADEVAHALSVTLRVGELNTRNDGTSNLEAYDAYLEGMAYSQSGGPENAERALARLETAVRIDPDFAKAWAVLAQDYLRSSQTYFQDRIDDYRQKARLAAERGVKSAPDSPSSLSAMALVRAMDRRWTDAIKLLDQSLEIAPTGAVILAQVGSLYATVGRTHDALTAAEAAFRAEPLFYSNAMLLAEMTAIAGDCDRALAILDDALAENESEYMLRASKATLGMAMQRPDIIREALIDAPTRGPGPTRNLNTRMLELLDQPESAIDEINHVLESPEQQAGLTYAVAALWASYFGAPEIALALHRTAAVRGYGIPLTVWRPVFKDMRRLKGFKDYIRDLGIVDYWRESGNWGDFCRPVGDDDFECK